MTYYEQASARGVKTLARARGKSKSLQINIVWYHTYNTLALPYYLGILYPMKTFIKYLQPLYQINANGVIRWGALLS